METKRTKHNYIYRMTAGNVQDDRVNTHVCTEWLPGSLDKTTSLTQFYSHNEYPENIQQNLTAERKHKYFDRMTAGILKTKHYETYYRTQFIHEIKMTRCTMWMFSETALSKAAWENFSSLKNLLLQIDSKLSSKPYDNLHRTSCNM